MMRKLVANFNLIFSLSTSCTLTFISCPTSNISFGFLIFYILLFHFMESYSNSLVQVGTYFLALPLVAFWFFETLVNKIEGIKESFVYGKPEDDGDYKICCKIVYDKDNVKEIYGTDEEEKLKESNFVKGTIGVGNVCETTALLAAKSQTLIQHKTVYPKTTVAIAQVTSK